MLKVVVVTCGLHGMAANCLPALVGRSSIKVVGVLHAIGSGTSRWRNLWRKFVKVLKIGILGAWNGKRIRSWFGYDHGDLREICQRNGIPFFDIVGLNSAAMVDKISELKPDLGLSLGNGFISQRVFTLPRLGMVNIHSEILPTYQNASRIIWPIYFNDPFTGFTIHEIERKIDAGRILYQRKYPLRFYSTLEETVRRNGAVVDKDIPAALAEVCENIDMLKLSSVQQGVGGSYTTPSIWQFWRMCRNNAKFFRMQEDGLR